MMKMKYLKTIFAVLASLSLFVSCDKQTNPDDGGKDPETPQFKKYTISADKSEVKIGEEVTFTVVSEDGEDVTSQCSLCYNVAGSTEGMCFGGNTMAWDQEGVYEVVAHYFTDEEGAPAGGIETENKVTVTVVGGEVTYTISATPLTLPMGESATFTVVDNVGEDVTSQFVFYDEVNGDYDSNVHTYDAIGKFQVYGKLKEDNSIVTVNSVKIIVTDPNPFENGAFYVRTLGAYMTGTWCSNCPSMAKGIKYIMSDLYPDRVVPVGFHWSTGATESQQGAGLKDLTNSLMGSFGLRTIPKFIVDMNKEYISKTYMGNVYQECPEVVDMIKASQALDSKHPGIACKTNIEGDKLNVEISVASRDEVEYYVGAILVEDHIIGYQSMLSGDPDTYEHYFVGQAMITDGSTLAEKVGVIKDQEEKVMNYSIDIPEKCNRDNCYVVAFVCKASADAETAPLGYLVSNVVKCPLGEVVNYQFEE